MENDIRQLEHIQIEILENKVRVLEQIIKIQEKKEANLLQMVEIYQQRCGRLGAMLSGAGYQN